MVAVAVDLTDQLLVVVVVVILLVHLGLALALVVVVQKIVQVHHIMQKQQWQIPVVAVAVADMAPLEPQEVAAVLPAPSVYQELVVVPMVLRSSPPC